MEKLKAIIEINEEIKKDLLIQQKTIEIQQKTIERAIEICNEEIKNAKAKIIIEIIKDFLFFGNSFNQFLEMEYEISKDFTKEDLLEIWKKTKEEVGRR